MSSFAMIGVLELNCLCSKGENCFRVNDNLNAVDVFNILRFESFGAKNN